MNVYCTGANGRLHPLMEAHWLDAIDTPEMVNYKQLNLLHHATNIPFTIHQQIRSIHNPDITINLINSDMHACD